MMALPKSQLPRFDDEDDDDVAAVGPPDNGKAIWIGQVQPEDRDRSEVLLMGEAKTTTKAIFRVIADVWRQGDKKEELHSDT